MYTFKFVNLFPIKIYQNYFREEIDADQGNYCLPQQCTHKATRYRLDIKGYIPTVIKTFTITSR